MSEPVYRRTEPLMGTLVTIEVVGHSGEHTQSAAQASSSVEAAVERAFDWFREIEDCCSRFDPRSELSRLSATVAVEVPVSDILFQAVQFALVISLETGGAFDPTIGATMERRGFNRNYVTGEIVSNASPRNRSGSANYRDVHLDPEHKTITLLRPLLLDLGAIAKGLAIDMAAHELRPFANFAINAGGDIYVAGHNSHGAPWSVGIRHPRIPGALIDSIHVSDCAVCTSGDYERRCPELNDEIAAGNAVATLAARTQMSPGPIALGSHHILDPRAGRSPQATASATVVAPTAMLADALATAAFVLGPADGIALLERLNVNGLIISPALDRHVTKNVGPGFSPAASVVDRVPARQAGV